MPNTDMIANQFQLLDTLRRRAVHLRRQQARLGTLTPFSIADDLREAQLQIDQIKMTLRGWGVTVPDQPEDAEPPAPPGQTQLHASAGLDALAELIRAPAARAAVAIYQANFENTCRQIGLLSGYKQLHDLLQQLEDRYTILARCHKNLQYDQGAWLDLEANEPELHDKAAELLDYAAGQLLADETAAWTPRLARARQDLRAALEGQHSDLLRDALRRVNELLGRQLSRVNTRMASVARTLQFNTLVAALDQISRQLDGASDVDRHRLGDFRRGVGALSDLDRRLGMSLRLHSSFQELDDELRRVEGTLEQSLDELLGAWPDLTPMLSAICAASSADWSVRLATLGAEVGQALTGEPIRLRRAFGRYRSHATVSFNRVDYDLRDLCAELQQIGAPLDRVLRMIA